MTNETPRAAAIAQWFHLCIPSCGPGFEFQAHYRNFFNLYYRNWNEIRTKLKRKRGRDWPIFTKKQRRHSNVQMKERKKETLVTTSSGDGQMNKQTIGHSNLFIMLATLNHNTEWRMKITTVRDVTLAYILNDIRTLNVIVPKAKQT